MGSILHGTEDFKFKLTSVGPRTRLEELSRASRSGTLFYVVDSYEVTFEDGETESIYLEGLEELLELDEDPECGFYQSNDFETEPAEILASLWKGEKDHAAELAEHFEEREPVSIEVYANVQFQLPKESWEAMLAYLNEHLPEDGALTLEEVGSFDVGTLLRFTPGEDEPQRDDGTAVAKHFHATLPGDGLPFLGFCILVHAVRNDIEVMEVDEEPLYNEVVWRAGAEKADKDDEEEAEEEDE